MKTTTFPAYFFGGTTRPLMIALSPEVTYFSAEFCDCNGLQLGRAEDRYHQLMQLRTPAQLFRLAEWLEMLHGEVKDLRHGDAFALDLPGFSPEFEDESVSGVYDATLLSLHAFVVREDPESGVTLYVQDGGPDDVCTSGIPWNLVPVFASALRQIASAWERDVLDLCEEQPMQPAMWDR